MNVFFFFFVLLHFKFEMFLFVSCYGCFYSWCGKTQHQKEMHHIINSFERIRRLLYEYEKHILQLTCTIITINKEVSRDEILVVATVNYNRFLYIFCLVLHQLTLAEVQMHRHSKLLAERRELDRQTLL